MGGDFNFDRILNFFPGNFTGSYQFNTLSSFQLGRPSAAGEPPKTGYEGWLRVWKWSSCGVGVVQI